MLNSATVTKLLEAKRPGTEITQNPATKQLEEARSATKIILNKQQISLGEQRSARDRNANVATELVVNTGTATIQLL